jgi:hypothetical protein
VHLLERAANSAIVRRRVRRSSCKHVFRPI